MKRMAVVMVATSLGGCPSIYPRHDPVIPPSAPAPIEGLNTEWDDYNAAKPPGVDEIIFSTNRGSQGHDLDVFRATVSWSASPKALGEPAPYAPQLMSPADERGPLAMSMADFVDPPMSGSPAVLSYASARDGGAGGLDLYWAEVSSGILHPLDHLSSSANDAYMTYRFGAVMKPRVLFASDRGGSGYDLFEATWNGYRLGVAPTSLTKVDPLSSDADDNAPFVARGNDAKTVIVFASKREGGRGGWDIWCSHFDGSGYSTPVPVTIANSEHDEFRPSIADADSRILVFSSNRPGGPGGYDLYAVAFQGCA
ncbi:MAG: PD40 domain-containing protein [Deltaproteobacteria bacterium]|nr:PD40 domain-containing protein [Deltaproteobacteria bacterium]MDQ3299523.1 hypothetical protein [Myxococcota bacterium]